jgi:hypothetical protein
LGRSIDWGLGFVLQNSKLSTTQSSLHQINLGLTATKITQFIDNQTLKNKHILWQKLTNRRIFQVANTLISNGFQKGPMLE